MCRCTQRKEKMDERPSKKGLSFPLIKVAPLLFLGLIRGLLYLFPTRVSVVVALTVRGG